MAFFQSIGIVLLLIFISSNHARYGIMASPPICSRAPGMPFGPTDFSLLLPNNTNIYGEGFI